MKYFLTFSVMSSTTTPLGATHVLEKNVQVTVSDERPTFFIGNDNKADVSPCVDDASVAKLHAVIELQSLNHITLLDLGSEHGCLLNGERAYKFRLKLGDKIQISPSTTITLTDIQEAPVNRLENLGKLVEVTKNAVACLQLNPAHKNLCIVQDFKIAAMSFGWPSEYKALVEALGDVFRESDAVEHVRASGTILGLVAVIYDSEKKG